MNKGRWNRSMSPSSSSSWMTMKQFLSLLLWTSLCGSSTVNAQVIKTILLQEVPYFLNITLTVRTPTNTDIFLPDVVIQAGGIVTVDIDYGDLGWIGFGISNSNVGAMIGSDAVIGTSDSFGESVLKYTLTSTVASFNLPLPNAQQTLLGASFRLMNGHSYLKYTKLLAESGEIEYVVDGSSPNALIYAVGSSNTIGYHADRGVIIDDLLAEQAPVPSGAPAPSPVQESVIQASVPTANPTNLPTTEPTTTAAAPTTDPPTAAPTTTVVVSNPTATPTANVPSYTSTRVVNDFPRVTISYTVRTPKDSSELTSEQVSAGGVIDVVMEYNGLGWLGMGITPFGQMIGSDAIIGTPSAGVQKYDLNMKSVTGIVPMPNQTLTTTNFEQDEVNGVTRMSFTKMLVEVGEHPYSVGFVNLFTFAVGSSNILGYHQYKGFFQDDLEF